MQPHSLASVTRLFCAGQAWLEREGGVATVLSVKLSMGVWVDAFCRGSTVCEQLLLFNNSGVLL